MVVAVAASMLSTSTTAPVSLTCALLTCAAHHTRIFESISSPFLRLYETVVLCLYEMQLPCKLNPISKLRT